jgi:hypothetical protein
LLQVKGKNRHNLSKTTGKEVIHQNSPYEEAEKSLNLSKEELKRISITDGS